ncbi:aminotransferase class IV [Methylobacterium sp. GC_Met_2]|uniref:aminotransferase class IV n=1 Tax=Methylobacterium sp. GC_Met_2 TaxID=2937376 RepID=UPI00226BB81B|nr:aminotransferase class IV [Methylobacterium sp. GC_Met_2]
MIWPRRTLATLHGRARHSLCPRSQGVASWRVEDSCITEGSAATAHILTWNGSLVSPCLSSALLHCIARASLLDIARSESIPTEERAFTPDEAKAAAKAFISSATNVVLQVARIDVIRVGDGRAGPISMRLRKRYQEIRLADAI